MQRLYFISLFVLQVAAVTTPVHAAPSSGLPGSDTIVLVLIDAMRPDHMGSYGYPKPTTPNLDAFAKDSRRYTRAYANAPWTRPSTVSFLTGYNGSRHRTESAEQKLPSSVVTLAQRLKKLGYTTAGFTANGNGGSLAGLEKGFDVFEDPTLTYKRSMRGKTYCCNGLPTGEFLVQRAIRWWKRDQSKKKFVFIFFVDPHDPYGAPPELEKMFLGDYEGKVRRHALWEANNDYPEGERSSMIALYDAGIRYADQSFGTFVDFLKKRGEYNNATIFVSADHGEGFGEHGFYLHAHHFWEEVVHIPLLIKSPSLDIGIDPRLTQSIDVAPTILGLAKAPHELPGHSLLNPPPPDLTIISEYNEFGIHRQAIVGGRYKVIWQRPADEAWYMRTAKKREYFPSVSFDKEIVRVYDLNADPEEKTDLAARGTKDPPPEAASLLKRLRSFVAGSAQRAAK